MFRVGVVPLGVAPFLHQSIKVYGGDLMSLDPETIRQARNEYQKQKRRERLARMTPEELSEYRKKQVRYQQEYRKRKKLREHSEDK